MDYKLFGRVVLNYEKSNLIVLKSTDENYFYKVLVNDNYNEVHILNTNHTLIVKFYDYIMDKNNLNTFKRIIDNQTYYFKDGELLVKKLIRKTSFLKSIDCDKKFNNKFMTMDIETRLINNVITPYSICFFDGFKNISFYDTDYIDSKDMLFNAISFIMKRKYHGYKIYVHNLSNFDGIFILKILASIPDSNLKPIIKDGKMIELKLSFSKYNISFRDSFLMLPSSLKNLAIQFKVENKGIFPYSFVNDVDLNYIGNVPEFKHFNNITIDEYNNYLNSFKNIQWNLKDETIKYCLQDCKTLYQIIAKFNNLIFDKYSLNIHNFPTLPSLAFGIYRAKYLNDHKIPLITGQIFKDIREGYSGGATDVYKPFGNNIFRYDVNSLYPYIMKSMSMPVGNITFFDGDITKINKNAFGFFNVEIIAPDNLNHPILQTRVDTGNGLRTVAPLGKWKDMIFSEEMNNAIKYGYKFNILSGYLFEQANIFSEYIEDLYEIKKSHNKDEPMYLISKLLMNSLYGRFGMDYMLYTHNIIEDNELYNLIDNYSINEIIPLDDNKSLVSYLDDNNIKNVLLSNESKSNISISIAAAITAGARIHMSQFKNNPNYNLYYSDTDSIDIDKPLPDYYVGKELGDMKLYSNIIFILNVKNSYI